MNWEMPKPTPHHEKLLKLAGSWAGSPAEVFKGGFDGDVLTVSHGGPNHARMTYDFSQDAKLKSRMEMSKDGRSWSTFFESAYEKK